jgi:hypothetical protein
MKNSKILIEYGNNKDETTQFINWKNITLVTTSIVNITSIMLETLAREFEV